MKLFKLSLQSNTKQPPQGIWAISWLHIFLALAFVIGITPSLSVPWVIYAYVAKIVVFVVTGIGLYNLCRWAWYTTIIFYVCLFIEGIINVIPMVSVGPLYPAVMLSLPIEPILLVYLFTRRKVFFKEMEK